MSEQLRHKMINYETPPPEAVWESVAVRLDDDKQYAVVSTRINDFIVTPPGNAWSNITSRLDDDKQYSAVATKLNNFDATPPSSSWSAIAARLDDDKQYIGVSTRLNDFEVLPPHSAWDTIAASINNEQSGAVATKMKNFEAIPPQQTWNNIAAALANTEEAKTTVINFRTTIYRMAAAAVVIGLLVGGWILVSNNYVKDTLVKNKQPEIPVNPSPKKETLINPGYNLSDQKVESVASLNEPSSSNAEKRNATINRMAADENNVVLKHAIVNDLLTYQEKPIVIHSSPILDREGNVIADMDVLTTSNYIVVMGPNGQTTRISSKFASVIRFLDGNVDDPAGTEEYLDKVIKESDTWKKRFQVWRSKISQSTFIPSASNFLDIVEFKELIQEKQ